MLTRDAIPVLVVDDDQAYADFIRQILSDAHGQRFDVEHVTHLSHVLPALESRKTSVVLLDNDAAQACRRIPKVDSAPLIG